MNRALLLSGLLAGSGLAACGGVSVTPDGAAGSLAGGGTSALPSAGNAGSVAGSSAGASGPLAQGNLTLNVQYHDPDLCPVADKTYVLGDPAGPNSVSPGDRLIDGANGAKITCSVHGSGPYTFSGTIHAMSSEGDTVTLEISDGVVNADGQTGAASIGVFTTQLNDTYNSGGMACPIRIVDNQIKAGSIWATFSCESVWPSNLGVCGIGPVSTFVLENCDG